MYHVRREECLNVSSRGFISAVNIRFRLLSVNVSNQEIHPWTNWV